MENRPENLERKIGVVIATPEDVLGIQEVFYKTWIETYPNEELGITLEDIEDRLKNSFTEESIKSRIEGITNPREGEMLFVAKENQKVLGLCRVVVYEDRNQLQAIYVLPEEQSKGIGTSLWKEAKKHFDQTKKTVVHVATYNTDAISFYKKLGFVETNKVWNDEKFKMKSGSIIPQMEMVLEVRE